MWLFGNASMPFCIIANASQPASSQKSPPHCKAEASVLNRLCFDDRSDASGWQ